MATDPDRLYTRADIRAWRDGRWYFVTLGGELVYKRYTRDESFTEAWVLFRDNQSPSLPQTGKNFDRVLLQGPWKTSRSQYGYGNKIMVAIERPGAPVEPAVKPVKAKKRKDTDEWEGWGY